MADKLLPQIFHLTGHHHNCRNLLMPVRDPKLLRLTCKVLDHLHLRVIYHNPLISKTKSPPKN